MRSRSAARLFSAAILLLGTLSALRTAAEADGNSVTPVTAAPTTAGALAATLSSQALASAILDDIRRADWDAAFAKMERRYYRESSVKELSGNLVAITGFYGQPVSFTYKGRETGERHYPDGEVKPYEKFWFAMPTTKYAVGVFAFVVVVPDGDQPRVAVVSMLTFPNDDRPPMLR